MGPPASKRNSTGLVVGTATSRTTRPSVGGAASSSLSRTKETTKRSQERASASRPSLAPKRAPPHQSSPTREAFQNVEDPNTADQELDSGGEELSPLESPLLEGSQEASIVERLRSTGSANGQLKPVRPAAQRPSSPQSSTRPLRPTTLPHQTVEELETKLKIMEKNRIRDRERLKQLEGLQQERDRFESIIQRLEPKIRTLQLESTELKKQLRESSDKIERLEGTQAEHDSALEMATLDREMAEEMAEGFKTELQILRSKMEELELEVEVLKEENELLGQETSPEEKTSQGWLKLDRTNERLREALMRLRDVSQEKEAELNDQITSLENDVKELADVKEEYEIAKEKILQSEADIEDLRQQLEAALGAEDMIEELAERNQTLTDRIEELNSQVEDLESLKELNDELEINHVEAEKQMQEEIDFKESLIIEHNRRAAKQDERLQDYEYTLVRFRELVSSQQNAIDDMTAAQHVTETEAAGLNERSKAMMDLNMKLQISASKTQVKTIDLELRRLDAQEASEHLAIVQLFLPDAFQSERDSVLALLRFKRIAFKAQLVHGLVKERLSNPATSGHENDLLAACDVLDKLTWIRAMCERFINGISSCSVERFAKFEGALFELEPVERALNNYIENLKKEELKEQKVAEELQRSMAVMEHLAEIHLDASVEAHADEILMRTLMAQSHLENTAAALLQTKAMIQTKVQANVETLEEDQNELDFFATKADGLISASRSAKVIVGKALRSLEDLKSRSLALNEDTEPAFAASEKSASTLAAYSRTLGKALYTLMSEEGRTEAFGPQEIKQTISSATSTFFNLSTPEPSLLSTITNHLRSTTEALSELAATAADLTLTTEFERATPPWVLRASALKAAKLTTVDTEDLLARARDDNATKVREIRLKEQVLDEQAVKIELLEARMKDAGRKGARVGELEREVDVTRRREKELAALLRKREGEMQQAVEEREEWRRVAGERNEVVATTGAVDGEPHDHSVATARELQSLRTQIRNLEGAVRHLRDDNRRARLVEPSLHAKSRHPKLSWLKQPLLPVRPATPAQQRSSALASESRAVLQDLLDLVDRARPVDLSSLPENKLAWQSARTKPRFQMLRQAEDWASWGTWRDEVTRRAREVQRWEESSERTRRAGNVVARMEFGLPMPAGEKGTGGEVRIVDPGEW